MEVTEHLQVGVGNITDVCFPLLREVDGVEHLGQVLHVLLVGAETLGEIVVLAVGVAMVVPDVLLGQRVQAYPVRVALAFHPERRAHADPVLHIVAHLAGYHVAEAVVGPA